MTIVTSAEFQKNFGTYKREALNHPVRISIHGKETLVLISKVLFDAIGNPGRDGAPAVEAIPGGISTTSEKSRDDMDHAKLDEISRLLASKAGVRFTERPSED